MFAYISTESGIWRQSIQRVVGDQHKIFFKLVDDDGTAIDLSDANAATVTCIRQNGDSIISAQTATEENASGGIISYTPTEAERNKMYKPGLYRFVIAATISSVSQQSWNIVSLRVVDN